MQASGSVDPGSNPSWGVIFLQKLSGKSEQDFGILRKVVNSYFKKILEHKLNCMIWTRKCSEPTLYLNWVNMTINLFLHKWIIWSYAQKIPWNNKISSQIVVLHPMDRLLCGSWKLPCILELIDVWRLMSEWSNGSITQELADFLLHLETSYRKQFKVPLHKMEHAEYISNLYLDSFLLMK